MYKEIILSCCLLLLVQRGSCHCDNDEKGEFSGLGYLSILILPKEHTLKECDLHIEGLDHVLYYNYTQPGEGLVSGITHIREYGEWRKEGCSIRVDLAKLARFAKSQNEKFFDVHWYIVGHWTDQEHKLGAVLRQDHFKFFMNTLDWIKNRSYSSLTLNERLTSDWADIDWR